MLEEGVGVEMEGIKLEQAVSHSNESGDNTVHSAMSHKYKLTVYTHRYSCVYMNS